MMQIEQVSELNQSSSNKSFIIQNVNESSSITIVDDYKSDSVAELPNKPYSIFSPKMKILIATTVSLSAFFSSFASNIYYPSLKVIEEDLQVTETMINLTITVYMIFQGISPSFWGSLADRWGRRPIYILTFFIYICACIGLACTQTYSTLLVMRMVQAFASSSAVAVSVGSIGDISLPSERGGYMGLISMGTTLGPLIGPSLGGVISYNLDWRWVFWVLTTLVTPLWLVHVFILPETLRSLVGDGSGYANPTPFQFWKRCREKKRAQQIDKEKKEYDVQQSAISLQTNTILYQTKHPQNNTDTCSVSSEKSLTKIKRNRFLILPNPFQSLMFLKEKDVAILLFHNAFQYSGIYIVITSFTGLLVSHYGLNSFEVGMCYLPNGFGAVIGSYASGRALDWQFRKTAKSQGNYEVDIKRHSIDLEFPIEKARMGTAWISGLIFSVSLIAYGWSFYYKAPIAIPIILIFILSGSCSMTFTGTSTLLVDLFPDNSAAIIASNNLIKCLLGAGTILIVQPGIKYMGVGWFFTAISLFLILTKPIMSMELRYGPIWRAERKRRQDLQEESI